MHWLYLTDSYGKKHLVNADNIIDVIYHDDSNLTEIIYLRSAIAPVWVRGNALSQIKQAYLSDVIRIGD